MARETKVGLVVAASFLCLVGVVVAARLHQGGDEHKDTPSATTKISVGKESQPPDARPSASAKPGEAQSNKSSSDPSTPLLPQAPNRIEIGQAPALDPSKPPVFDPSKPPMFDASKAAIDPSKPPVFDPSKPPAFDPSKPPAFDPSKPAAIDPSKPPAFDPSKPTAFDPSKPAAIDPSKPPAFDPSKPAAIDPSKSPVFDPSKPPAFDPSKPAAIDPSKPPAFDPSKPPAFDPSKPAAIDPSKPPAFDPSKPPAFDPSKPAAIDPSKPPAFDPSKPPAFDPSKPPAFDPSKPPAFDPSKPAAIDPSKPPAFDPSKPPAFDPSKPAAIDPSKPPAFDPSKPPVFDPTKLDPAKPNTSGLPAVKDYLVKAYRCEQGITTFPQVSKKLYDNEKYAQALYQFNRDSNVRVEQQLQPGQEILYPPVDVLVAKYSSLFGAAIPPTSGNPAAPLVTIRPAAPLNNSIGNPNNLSSAPPGTAITPVSNGPYKSYKVRDGGEHILMIAENTLGDRNRWAEIYRLNGTIDPKTPLPGGAVIQFAGQRAGAVIEEDVWLTFKPAGESSSLRA